MRGGVVVGSEGGYRAAGSAGGQPPAPSCLGTPGCPLVVSCVLVLDHHLPVRAVAPCLRLHRSYSRSRSATHSIARRLAPFQPILLSGP